MSKAFASQADLQDKQVTFEQLSEHAWAYTAEGDPNTGVVIGDNAVMVIDTQATPVMARDVIRHIRAVTDKPIKYVTLSHYHAVRVLGASAFDADVVVAHDNTRALIAERGRQDWESELGRMPRLFKEPDSIPGLTWPTLTFSRSLSIQLGGDRGTIDLHHCGRGHTEGDIVAWLPQQRVLFAGDLVEARAALYTGDGFHAAWAGRTLDHVASFPAESLVGGRGAVAHGRDGVRQAVASTRRFLTTMLAEVGAVHGAGGTVREAFERTHAALEPEYGAWPIFEHCLPFDVQRLWDELDGIVRPRIWTAERDRQVWAALQE